jgi:hypothetical protein
VPGYTLGYTFEGHRQNRKTGQGRKPSSGFFILAGGQIILVSDSVTSHGAFYQWYIFQKNKVISLKSPLDSYP